MHEDSIIVACPEASNQLVLLFHGVGSSAQDLVPLGLALSRNHPHSTVVSVQAPQASQLGHGNEWFSVIGVTEENRPQRIQQSMPKFFDAINHWQKHFEIEPQRTVLVGFSQGAIMSLEASQVFKAVAGKVIAIAGRFAQAVRYAPVEMKLHLIHGEQDAVVSSQYSIQAQQQLKLLGLEATLDLLSGLGHGIDERALQLVSRYLN